MSKLCNIFGMALALIWMTTAWAAEQGTRDRLEAELRKAVPFQYGQDDRAVKSIDRIIVEAAQDAGQRAAAERQVLKAAQEVQTRDAKEFICRQLYMIGGAESVPLLEQWLLEPEISHAARYALGRMPIPEAPAAIHRVMHQTTGALKVGMINTLGNLHYQPAAGDLAKLLLDGDAALIEAAALALGQIGGKASVRALESVRSQVRGETRLKIEDALMACGDRFLASNQKDQAARIYEILYRPDSPKQVRVGALRGLLAAQGPRARGLLLDAIKGGDTSLRASAISFAAAVPGQEMTQSLTDLLPSLLSEAQVLLLNALAMRADPRAAPAVMDLIANDHERVRVAVLEALGSLGHPASVEVLAQAAALRQGTVQQAARASLWRLSGPDIMETMLRLLSKGEPKMRVELIRAVANRRASEASSTLLKVIGDADVSVRREAIRALGVVGGERELVPLLHHLGQTQTEDERNALSSALELVLRRLPNTAQKASAISEELNRAKAKASLLPLLVYAPTEHTLATVLTALKESDPVVQDAAVRTLANWPDAAATDELLTLAQSTRNPMHKVLALRGYVRLAGLAPNAAGRYERAMTLADSVADKKIVLAGLGSTTSKAALDLALKHIQDEALRTDAAAAATQIADQLRQKDPIQAKAALKTVVATVKEPRLRQKAREIINDIEKFEGYLLNWLILGPYKDKDKEGIDLFDTAFPPEKGGAGDLKWQPLQKGIGAWDIVLDTALASGDNQVAYLRTCLWSPETQEVQMELGSDDAIKVWLNGDLVHANFTSRGLSPRQDLVKARLQQGWNELMLKIVNHGGGWACCCRLRQPDGSALDGIRVEAQ